jgi:hypothetical protein
MTYNQRYSDKKKRKLLSEIKRLETRQRLLEDKITECILNNRPVDPKLIQEFNILKKFKQSADKMMDKLKVGSRIAYDRFDDVIASLAGKGMANYDKIARELDLDDQQAEILKNYAEDMEENAGPFKKEIQKFIDGVTKKEFDYPNTDGSRSEAARVFFKLPKKYFALDTDVFKWMTHGFLKLYAGVYEAHKNGMLKTDDANKLIKMLRDSLDTQSKRLEKVERSDADSIEDASRDEKKKTGIGFYQVSESNKRNGAKINKKAYYNQKLSYLIFEDLDFASKNTGLGHINESEDLDVMKKIKEWKPVLKGIITGAIAGSLFGTATNASAIYNSFFENVPDKIIETMRETGGNFTPDDIATHFEPGVEQIMTQVSGEVPDGKGLTQLINTLMPGANLSPTSTMGEFIDSFSKTFGNGNYSRAVENITGTLGAGNPGVKALEAIANADPSATVGRTFVGKLAGTGKQIGDLLWLKEDSTWIADKALEIATQTQTLIEKNSTTFEIVKQTVKGGRKFAPAAGAMATLGILAPWAIGGAIAGGTVAALMKKNAVEKSRAAVMNRTYRAMQFVDDSNIEIEEDNQGTTYQEPLEPDTDMSATIPDDPDKRAFPGESDVEAVEREQAEMDKSGKKVKESEIHDILLRMVDGDAEALERTGAKSSIAAYLRDRGITVEHFKKMINHQKILKESKKINSNSGNLNSANADRWAVLAGIKK